MKLSNLKRLTTAATVVASLAGCAAVPPAYPTVMALPQSGKPLSEFQQDDASCRTYAAQLVNPVASAPAVANAGLAAPVVGAAGGAAAGALIGLGAGNAGAGAAIGAGAGLLLGRVAGQQQHGASQAALQQQYDNAYAQCIVAHGDSIASPAPRPAVVAVPTMVYAPAQIYYAPW